ncbi:hypothetical protein [Microbacterium sp. MPKO10]|uniref:hypothetical protein n=1 Tax=Microbacterium sp. MPKO10 TaxID=2989818 RepID=UPI002235A069|nr:hypothetical protein [Microbacterium sp. MPKO10]MCW4457633.1 hypothetical protein [Microbacterium sp. MPKO10]
MTDSLSPLLFDRFLAQMDAVLGDQTPITKTFVEGLRARQAHASSGGPGVTVETLVADLVSVLSGIEMRLKALEEAAEGDLGDR